MPEILAVDIGTSRIKCALFDENGHMSHLLGRRLDRASSPNLQNAEVWTETAASLLRELTALPDCPKIDAVALTGNMHALLGVDSCGVPVAPAVLWSDNSAALESDMLNRRYGQSLLDKFGNSSIPVFTLPKILRMKKVEPEQYDRTCKFLQSKDFIAFFLTGHFITDPSDASGTLLMELESGNWSEELLDDLELDCRNSGCHGLRRSRQCGGRRRSQ